MPLDKTPLAFTSGKDLSLLLRSNLVRCSLPPLSSAVPPTLLIPTTVLNMPVQGDSSLGANLLIPGQAMPKESWIGSSMSVERMS